MSTAVRIPFGPYLLTESLGRGGAGTVHLARTAQPIPGVPDSVVVKRLHAELAQQEFFARRFRHEAEIAVSIDSAHVAHVYDVGSVGETLYIAFEHVKGATLLRLLRDLEKRGELLSEHEVLKLGRDALLGLHAIHTALDRATNTPLGIVHRDVAPKNLMVRENGEVCLIDLGLGSSSIQDWKTHTGTILGTPGYMSPEQASGLDLDPRTDLYAVGVVLFELATLQRYLPHGSLAETLAHAADPPRTRPSSVREDLSEAFDRVLMRALAPRREDRYASAADMIDDVQLACASAARDDGPSLLARWQAEKTEQKTRVEGPEEEMTAENTAPGKTVIFARTAPPLPPPRSPPLRIAILAAALAMIAAAIGTVALLDATRTPDPVEEAIVVPPEAQNAEKVETAPKASAARAEPHVEALPLEAPAPGPAKRAKGVAPPVKKDESAPLPAREEDSPARIARLTKLGRTLKARLPDRAREIDEILSDIAMEAGAADDGAAAVRLHRLESRLEAIGE